MTWTIYRRSVPDAKGRAFRVWRTEPIGFGSRARGYAAHRLQPHEVWTPTVIVAWSEREALTAAGFAHGTVIAEPR